MTAITQQPHSVTNPTDRYRVVLYENWIDFINGGTQVLAVESDHGSLAEANAARDELNRAEIAGHKPKHRSSGKNGGLCERCGQRPATVRLTIRTPKGNVVRRIDLCTTDGEIEDRRARNSSRRQRVDSEPLG